MKGITISKLLTNQKKEQNLKTTFLKQCFQEKTKIEIKNDFSRIQTQTQNLHD